MYELSMKGKPYILCIDDERPLLDSLKNELNRGLKGEARIEIADSAEDGLELLDELLAGGFEVAVIISDQLMPGMKGDEFLIRVNELHPRARKILLTGQASAEAVGNVVNRANLYRFIAKPWDEEDLLLTVQQAIASYFTEDKLDASLQVIRDLNRYATLVTEEVQLDRWASRLLAQLLRDTHSTRVVLHVMAPEQELTYELAHTSEAVARRIDRSAAGLPQQALERCTARRTELVYNLATANGQAAGTDWESFGTFYCAPLIKQDRLLGVLYLENRQAPVHYTEERLAFLNALVQQLPAPLDNVLLYESLEEKVRERTRIIEEKNESITDSINYARRIQLAILPDTEQLSQYFPQHFIFYQPKDIVCGDFYWWTEVQDYFFVAAVDCTGHGVPGAFMSVLGYSFLNQLVREHRFLEPDTILNQLHRRVFAALKQGQHTKDQPELHDGMDLILCRFDRRNGELAFAGANRPLLLLRDRQLSEFKTDRQPIGGSLHGESPEDRNFTSQTLHLETGDRLYLFSDGFTDQFGGEDHRKFGSRRFQEILEAQAGRPLPEHTALLEREYLAWRGTTPQTDDILCIGLEVG